MIDEIQQRTGAGIRSICRTLDLPRSSYYHAAQPTDSELADEHVGQLIEEIFVRHRSRYGYRRIYRELQDHDITCAPSRVLRIMKEKGLTGDPAKKLHSKNQRWKSYQTGTQSARRQASPRAGPSSLDR